MEWVHVGGSPDRMKIYFAPLEGVTTYIFRHAFAEIYGHVDKFFAPFISPFENCPLTPRERKDIAPENNIGIHLVPQILTCRSDHFIDAAKALSSMGYRELNFNLGCPSGTVCAKRKGAGFLQDTDALQCFLSDIYSFAEREGMKISIKTRLGYQDPDEFYKLMEVYSAFPVYELIVHPRIRTDFYKGEIRKEYFAYAREHATCPLVYNGNIFSCADYDSLVETFGCGSDSATRGAGTDSAMRGCGTDSAMLGKNLDPVMLGRGLVSDPELAGRLKGAGAEHHPSAVADELQGAGTENHPSADADERRGFASKEELLKFRRFHDTLYHEYQKVMSPDINVLHKMRELWTYWQVLLDGKEREIKRLMKAKKYEDYEAVLHQIFLSEEGALS